MPWSDYPVQNITLPGDASDSDPRIVIGPDLPSTLTRPGVTFTAGIIYWYDATTYGFEAIGVDAGTKIWVRGTYDPTHGLYYTMYQLIPDAGRDPFLAFGSADNPLPKLIVSFIDCDVAIAGDSQLFSTYGTDMGSGEVGCGYRNNGFINSGGAEVAIAAASWTVEPESAFLNNHIYKFEWRGQIGPSAAGGMGGTVRVRYGSGTIAGAVLTTTYVTTDYAGWFPTRTGYGYAVFTGASTSSKVSLTIQKINGVAGTIFLDSDGPSNVRLEITDMGDATDNAFLAAGAPTFP